MELYPFYYYNVLRAEGLVIWARDVDAARDIGLLCLEDPNDTLMVQCEPLVALD